MHRYKQYRFAAYQNRSRPFIERYLEGRELDLIRTCDMCGSEDLVLIASSDRYGARLRTAMCSRCGLVFLADRPTAEDYGEFYQNVYRPLLTAFLDWEDPEAEIVRQQNRYGRKLIEALDGWLPDGGRLIDIGGSTGVIAAALRDRFGFQPTVLDPAGEELAVAAEAGMRTVHALFEDWDPGEGDSYELVLCCRTIDHFLGLRSSLEKLGTLVAEGGLLYIDIVDFRSVWQRAGRVEGALKVDHCYYLNSENTPALLRSVGLDPVVTELVTSPERVGYLCRRCEPVALPEALRSRASELVRQIQVQRLEAREEAKTRPPLTFRALRRLKRLLG